jgi:hypothetical protein
MKLEDIRKEVENIVDDSSFSPDEVVSYINQAISYASGVVNIPSLKRVGSVTLTDDDYSVSLSSLTDEIIGMITYAVLDTGKELNILNGVEELLMFYPLLDEVGTPSDLALEGTTLWYQPMGDYSCSLVYYTKPAMLSDKDDVPSNFPDYLHRSLFVHGAAWMMFDMIEDGLDEGKKVNTQSHFFHSFDENNRHSGIVKLREWVSRNRVHHISSTWRY